MIVVSDSSVITGLLSIDKLFLLNLLFEKVLISPEVNSELRSLSKYGFDITKLQTSYISIQKVREENLVKELNRNLDLGEAESIALSIEIKAEYLLIDEKKGRKLATQYGLKIIGLVGILILAKRKGYITLLKPELEKLTHKLEFRLSKSLITAALKSVNE